MSSGSVQRLAPALGDPVVSPVRSHSDELYGVLDYEQEGPLVRATMPLTDRHREADGRLSPGMLGVLIDSVLAYTCLSDPDRWSLTIEMTVDVFPGLHTATGSLHAEAQAAHSDRFGGYATGFVRDDDGGLVAACSQVLRYTEGRPPPVQAASPDGTDRPRDARSVRDMLVADGTGAVGLSVVPQVQNPVGNLHGGVSMYACERAVAGGLARSGSPGLTTTSLRVTYLRAAPGGSHVTFTPTVVHAGRTLAVVDVVGAVDTARPAIRARATAEPRH